MIAYEIHGYGEEPGPYFRFRQILLQEPDKGFLRNVIRDIGVTREAMQISKEGWIQLLKQ